MLPLDDVRVLDLTHYTVGPFATRVLSDYGADVVKIERPGGDPARQLPPFPNDEPHPERSGTFLALNTNKRSVVIDLKTERGRELCLRLVESAGIVVENFAPGTLDRLGLGYEELRARNPRVVLTSISNFGQDGPYRDWQGVDLTLYAIGGAMVGQGHPEHEPLKLAGRAAGYHVGLAAAYASAIGLLGAERRGSGEHVDLSIAEALLQSPVLRITRLLGFQYNGRVVNRSGGGYGVGHGVFPCADGYVLITSGPARLPATMRMIGHEALLDEPEWATLEARSDPARIPEFEQLLLPWTLARTKAQIRAECERFGVLGGPLNSVGDVVDDESFVARKFFQEIDHPEAGPQIYPGYQFRIRSEPPRPPRRRAPLLGEHTAEVLGETLGLGDAELASLQRDGVVTARTIEEPADAVTD